MTATGVGRDTTVGISFFILGGFSVFSIVDVATGGVVVAGSSSMSVMTAGGGTASGRNSEIPVHVWSNVVSAIKILMIDARISRCYHCTQNNKIPPLCLLGRYFIIYYLDPGTLPAETQKA